MEDKEIYIVNTIGYAIVNKTLIIRIPSIVLDSLKSIEIYSEEGLEIALDHEVEGLTLRENFYIN